MLRILAPPLSTPAYFRSCTLMGLFGGFGLDSFHGILEPSAEMLQHPSYMQNKHRTQLGFCSISALGSSIPWNESRPKPPNKPIRVHDLKYASKHVASKLLSLRSELADAGSSAIVISMLDEIAWLLNLRGSDVCILDCGD
ncbi:putative Xaa-Pro aminopeptidase P [Prunus yedoensis var. nudiflora]|uniref:Putative Xaa-Pro aminopeptidase P n=1 Tax=Prunus yedoensis var. nudiflora TaxID=2094558 RepID=A0A314YDG6_PRUYE|nr:putative Xaa-Pro aminopeptidase P [Prunus yedoensis var. nudiflora]